MRKIKEKIVWINLIILTFFISDCFFKKFFLKRTEFVKHLGFLKLGLYKNDKIAFFFPSKNIFVLFLIFLVLTYLIFKLVIFYKKKKIILITSLTAIILGAFSNLFERFIYGYVTDYISFLSLGVFNLSDVLIAFGVILLLYIKIKKG